MSAVSPSGAGTTLRPRPFAWLVLAVAALAWASLAAWSASPYARFVAHGGWLDDGLFADLCRAIPQGSVIVPTLAHSLAWLCMIAAMMLPTTLPLLALFGRVTAGRPDAARLNALVIAGYGLAWMAFGVLAHALDAAVHAAAGASGWVATHGWVAGAAVLAGAGAFQFSDLKYRCLERCRLPFGFVNERWRGRPLHDAFRIGLDHGLFCVGCCWALMLLMFVVGMGNLAWMLLIGLAMAAEKNLPWGKRLSTPLGLALLASAAGVVIANA
jgi:predicted metal-binding membrane protein